MAIAPYERTGERVRIMDVGDGILDVPHPRRSALASLPEGGGTAKP